MKRIRIIAHDVTRSANLPARAVVHYALERAGTGRTLCGRALRHWAIVHDTSMPASCRACCLSAAKDAA